MISVVIPSHNRPERLRTALESVYGQTVPPAEIIVVDDASSPAISASIFDSCPTVISTKLIRNEVSLKASGARNIGILNASNEYVAFLDDDDVFLENKILRVKEILTSSEYPDILYHAAEICMVNERVQYNTSPANSSVSDFRTRMLVSNLVGGTPLVVAKKRALIRAGLFDAELPALEDYELWLRMSLEQYTFKGVDDVLTRCFYRTKEGSVSKHIDANRYARERIRAKYATYYSQLTGRQSAAYREYVGIEELHRFLLTYNYRKAVKMAIAILSWNFSVKNLLRMLVVMCGPRFAFIVRSWM